MLLTSPLGNVHVHVPRHGPHFNGIKYAALPLTASWHETLQGYIVLRDCSFA